MILGIRITLLLTAFLMIWIDGSHHGQPGILFALALMLILAAVFVGGRNDDY